MRRTVAIADVKLPDYRQRAADAAVGKMVDAYTTERDPNAARLMHDVLDGAPITVNERDGELFIVDGWVRLKALERLGQTEVEVDVTELCGYVGVSRADEALLFQHFNTMHFPL